MIVSSVSDPALRRAVFSLAAPDEDVFEESSDAWSSVRQGFVRGVVRESPRSELEPVRVRPRHEGDPPEITITAGTLARWRFDYKRGRFGPGFESGIVERLRPAFEQFVRVGPTDVIFRGLERAAGVSLPPAFRGMARRILEHPRHYASLGSLADRVGVTPGALQGRFLRRGLKSPSEHLRWLRILAVAEGFHDAGTTVAAAAERYGYTSAGNLCRTLDNTSGKTPSDLREPLQRVELVTRFAGMFLDGAALQAWPDLKDLFCRVPAVSSSSKGLTA